MIVEGDSMTLITKLKKKVMVPTELGLLIGDILRLCSNFDFHAFSFVRREGNKIAHSLAHLQPYVPDTRVWFEDGPDRIFDLAVQDLCSNILIE